ncbi:Vacuolar sorting protein 9 (VPS9) domain [Popillia japonica]|uniref:Receptor-mediated endocytosis protein 6 homolog n=1 Tax=Popillia japonica TaxID=7064 RepID=A0AAW1JZI0_POPJA
MVSANVSGRGSPNISGRDTPSSQVTENEDARAHSEVRQPYLQQSHHINKQIRSEIDDKFCKFEIKKLIEGDETVSIISDTWSTDVLASDSETIDATDGRQERQNFSAIIEQPIDHHISNPLLDISETQSESAWSMDALASDMERLTEVDNDDLVSVAPSDDTASVARSDDAAQIDDGTRSEIDEGSNVSMNDRRSSAPGTSNPFAHNIDNNNFHPPSNYQEYRRIVETRQDASYLNSNNIHVASMNNFEHTMENSSHLRISKKVEMNISKISELQGILNKRSDLAGPSGMNEAAGNRQSNLVPKSSRSNKYEDMQLSNSSLNSSSSGSSNGSENQNKNNFSHKNEHWKGKVWANGSGSSLNITSTPSESTSELSVLSVNTLVSPVNNINYLDRKAAGMNPKILKPSVSTGAIPKSISFDTTADKNYREVEEDQKSKRATGFFGKFKMGFRSRRGKSIRVDDYNVRFGGSAGDDDHMNNKRYEYTNKAMNFGSNENSEDILAKYRNKNVNDSSNQIPVNNTPSKPTKLADIIHGEVKIDYNMNSDYFYSDYKRKLRLVLSNTEQLHSISDDNGKDIKKYLEVVLQLELAKAKSLRQLSVVARTAEALRCIRTLDNGACHKLFAILKEEYCQRSIYMRYLLNSKQILLNTEAYLNLLEEQLKRDKELCDNNLIELCVRFFLEKQEKEIQDFCDEFQSLKLVDEKNDHLMTFLNDLHLLVKKDVIWQDTSKNQLKLAHLAIEQSVMTKVYIHALYPNGDGDRDRDRVLHEHLKKLSSMITPHHKDLMINKIYLNECPWLPAQEALQAMAAYRTPRDKVGCVIRCTTAIMDLLSFAQDRGSTTADDFIPVLVYVIIRVNPQALLSTIQYVNSFYSSQITGEDEYWWTQFCSAVEYTKTMDYSY